MSSLRSWLFLVLFLGCACVYYLAPKTVIPRTIWTYWNGDVLPELVVQCTEKWKHLNPDHVVRIVSPKNVGTYIPKIPSFFKKLTPQQQADWVRLHLLKEYGGLWVDASIMVSESFAWVHECESGGGLGYYIQESTTLPEYPVMENWFIAAAPGHPFIVAWCKEFHRNVATYGSNGPAYIRELKRRYGPAKYERLVQKIGSPEYLTMHMAAQKLMQIDGMKPFKLLKAEDGPFVYLERAGWEADEYMDILAVQTHEKTDTNEKIPKFVKVRGVDRESLNKVTVSSGSLYARYFS